MTTAFMAGSTYFIKDINEFNSAVDVMAANEVESATPLEKCGYEYWLAIVGQNADHHATNLVDIATSDTSDELTFTPIEFLGDALKAIAYSRNSAVAAKLLFEQKFDGNAESSRRCCGDRIVSS